MRRFDQGRQWDRDRQGSYFLGPRSDDQQHSMNSLGYQYGNMNINGNQQQQAQSQYVGAEGSRSVQRSHEWEDMHRYDTTQRYNYETAGVNTRQNVVLQNSCSLTGQHATNYQNTAFQKLGLNENSRINNQEIQNKSFPLQFYQNNTTGVREFNRQLSQGINKTEHFSYTPRDTQGSFINQRDAGFQSYQRLPHNVSSFGNAANSAHLIPRHDRDINPHQETRDYWETKESDVKSCHRNRHDYRSDGSKHNYRNEESRYGYQNEGSKHDYRSERSRHDHRNEGSRHDYWNEGSRHDYRNEGSRHDHRNEESRYGYRNEGSRHDYRNEGSKHDCRNEGSRHNYQNEGSRHDFRNERSTQDTRVPTSPSYHQRENSERSNNILITREIDKFGKKKSFVDKHHVESSVKTREKGHKAKPEVEVQGQTDRLKQNQKQDELSVKENKDENNVSEAEDLGEEKTTPQKHITPDTSSLGKSFSNLVKTPSQVKKRLNSGDSSTSQKESFSESVSKCKDSSDESSQNMDTCNNGQSDTVLQSQKSLDDERKMDTFNNDQSTTVLQSQKSLRDERKMDTSDKTCDKIEEKKSVEKESVDKMPELRKPSSQNSKNIVRELEQINQSNSLDVRKSGDDNVNKVNQSSFLRQDEVRKKIIESAKSAVDERYTFRVINDSNTEDVIEKEENTGGSDLDIDVDSDSDDDELEQPSFLVSLQEASNRPIPGTPTKFSRLDLSQSSNPDSPQMEENCNFEKKPSLKSGFSLDFLLAETTDKPEDQKEYEEIHAELREGLRKGGFVADTLEQVEDTIEDELLPEYQVKLQHFQVSASNIRDVHPGEKIFDPERYQQLFTQSLQPCDCGFVPGNTYIDNYLSTVLPDDYMSFLSSDILMMCFDNVSCPDAVCRWLYYIMSIHNSHLVINGCCKVLEDHLNNQIHYTPKNYPTWSPTASDLLTVLLNCGGCLAALLPDRLHVPGKEELKDLVHPLNVYENNPNGRYNRENLRLVIRVLALCLQARPKHTSQQLTCMVIMLCKAALDQSLNNYMLTYEIQVCIASLLQCYSTDEWKTQAPRLCQMLSSLTDHHHNIVYLGHLFPHGSRGNFIQRRMSYIALKNMFLSSQSTDLSDIENFQLKDLNCLMPKLRELAGSNLNKHSPVVESNPSDMYKLTSALSLLDMSVGNGIIKSSEKNDLQFLTDQLKKITGDVRDNVRTLDRTRVKDMMVRVTSKWTLVLLTVGSKQRSIFAYYPNKQQEVHIETVQSTQSDHDSSDSEETESQEMETETKIISCQNEGSDDVVNESKDNSIANNESKDISIANNESKDISIANNESKDISMANIDDDVEIQDELPELSD